MVSKAILPAVGARALPAAIAPLTAIVPALAASNGSPTISPTVPPASAAAWRSSGVRPSALVPGGTAGGSCIVISVPGMVNPSLLTSSLDGKNVGSCMVLPARLTLSINVPPSLSVAKAPIKRPIFCMSPPKPRAAAVPSRKAPAPKSGAPVIILSPIVLFWLRLPMPG